MTFTRSLPYRGFLLAVFGMLLAEGVYAQSQKSDYPRQKSSPPERLEQEPMRQGGYQAPPPTGALQGATREFGLSGGEIELPALRLRLPRVRLPALSVFLTPPQMQMEPAVAPLVQQVQEQVSVPAGRTEPPTEPLRESTEQFRDPDDTSDPYQKGDLTGLDSSRSQPVDSAEIARIRNEMDQFERRMDQKLTLLTQSIEVLVAERRSEEAGPIRDARHPDLVPLPMTEDPAASQVRPSSYLFLEPIPRVAKQSPQPRRLPPMTR